MGINLSGQVPGEQLNGLLDMEDELLHERTPDPFIAVVVLERASRKYDDVKQVTSAVVRFKHIEPLQGEAAAAARKLLHESYADRTGEATLPIELEDEPKEISEPTPLDVPADDEPDSEPADNVTGGPWDPSPDDEPKDAA
jgi:hypothetical protein